MSQVRFAVIGFGKVARTRFLPAIARSRRSEVVVIASGRAGIESSPSEAPDTPLVSYEEFFASWTEHIDAVYIALPNHLHLDWVERAARVGLHVLCEKPLAADSETALAARRLCHERGVLLAEGFMYRHDPRHARVRSLVQQGAIGRAGLIEASFSYLLEDLGNIRLNRRLQGGALMDVGCYGVDLARYLCAEEPSHVDVHALWGRDSMVDELTSLTLTFPSGRIAMISASTHLIRRHLYQVIGTEGVISVPDAFIGTENGSTQIEITDREGASRVEVFPPFDQFLAEIECFSEAILDGATGLPEPMEDGVANAQVLERAQRRLVNDQRVSWSWGRNQETR